MQCDKSYIGETGRSLKTRLSEHVRATKYKDSNYATFSPSLETGHSMDFENVEVVDKGKSYNHRLHLEAAYITTNSKDIYKISIFYDFLTFSIFFSRFLSTIS